MAPRPAYGSAPSAVHIPADVQLPFQDFSDEVLRAIDVFAGLPGDPADVQAIAERFVVSQVYC